MFVRKLHPFGKSPSRPASRLRPAKALPGASPRPQVERLEDRMLLSAANQALVGQMYQDLLQRPADAAGLANWTAALDHGVSPAQVALNLAQSPEGRALQVQTLYQQFLHREADSAGLAGFTQALAAGQTLEQVAAALVTSPEYSQNRDGGTDSGFLTALYQDALSRQADASGAAAYAQALAGGTTRGQVIQAIFGSAELQQDMVQHDYQYFLHRAADAAGLANWTEARQHGMRDEQIAAAIVGSPEYAQSVQLQQTLLPSPPVAGVPVIVVNTPSQPVPVTGIVTGTVTGTVQAQQSGPWTVGISGTPTVQVASSLTNPVFVRDVNSVAQPFRIELVGLDMIATPMSFTVPAGKRLVIQDVSVGAAALTIGARGFFRLYTGIDFLDIPTTFAYREGMEFDRLVGHEQATFSIDPGTPVRVSAEFPRGTSVNGFMSISGYLVNVP